jgi:ribosomal protein S6
MRLSEQVIRYMTLKLPAKKATAKDEVASVKELATAEA